MELQQECAVAVSIYPFRLCDRDNIRSAVVSLMTVLERMQL